MYQGAFTVSYWIRQDTITATKGHFLIPYKAETSWNGQNFHVDDWTTPYVRWMIRTENNGVMSTYLGEWSSGGGTYTSTTYFGIGWHHMVVRFDGTTDSGSHQVWIDGVKRGNFTSAVTALTDDGNNLYMGTVHGLFGGDEQFKGFMHNVAIFDNTSITS